MHYVIIRDDDTNALTPPECLERLYRPFLDRGMPVNLAVIPEVTTEAKMADGRPEGFLCSRQMEQSFAATHQTHQTLRRSDAPTATQDFGPWTLDSAQTIPITSNPELARYILDNPGYHVVQHGCHHDYMEFDRHSRAEISSRLDLGTERLLEAGFAHPQTFVAPHDRLSREALLEVKARFRILSTGWYEAERLPLTWRPRYLIKKWRHAPHWQIGSTLLLSHPGCLLSYMRSLSEMRQIIPAHIQSQGLTVLVNHWWEYFRDGSPDEPFIAFLHETADYLASNSEIQVISFSDLVGSKISAN